MNTDAIATLTDRDLMLNLYVNVRMAIATTDTDLEACQQQLLRADDEPSVTDHVATLADIMAEVEQRLGIQGSDIDVSDEPLH